MMGLTDALDTPRRDQVETAVRAYLAFVDSGDVESRIALFAPDAIFEDPVGKTILRGHDAMRTAWQAGSGLKVTITLERLSICGDEAAYLFTADLQAAPGDVASLRVIETLRLDELGRIASMRAFFDRASIS